MLIVIFTYNRRDKLKRLLGELKLNINHTDEVLVIDDGSDWSKDNYLHLNKFPFAKVLRTQHTGKQGYWRKWLIAHQLCLGSRHEYFCFMADDFEGVKFNVLRDIESQGWEEHLFAINLANDGRTNTWGGFTTNQPSFKINDTEFNEVGFVDCGFITNRFTLSKIEVDQIPSAWFDHKDKSSGVGAQLTRKFRTFGVKMMTPTPTIVKHGAHESVMHGEHRKQTPLIAK